MYATFASDAKQRYYSKGCELHVTGGAVLAAQLRRCSTKDHEGFELISYFSLLVLRCCFGSTRCMSKRAFHCPTLHFDW